MQRSFLVLISFFLFGLGAWFAFQYEPDDPDGRAKLISWAEGFSGSTMSETMGWSCKIDAAVDDEKHWRLDFSVAERGGAGGLSAARPSQLRVEVNGVERTGIVDETGTTTVVMPLSAFRLNQRGNDVRINVMRADGREFGGWAFGRITFSKDKVGVLEPTWFEKLID